MPPKPKGKKTVVPKETGESEHAVALEKPAGENAAPSAAASDSTSSYVHKLEEAITTVPIYFISTHGQYDVVGVKKEDLSFKCPPNTYIFETAGVQNITSIDIDPLLWYLMQSPNRQLFIDIFRNTLDSVLLEKYPDIFPNKNEIYKFKHIFKHVIFYKPGDNVPIRKLTLQNIQRKYDVSSYILDGKLVQVNGRLSTRNMYASMGFWQFLKDKPYYTFPRVMLDYNYIGTHIDDENNSNNDENYEPSENEESNGNNSNSENNANVEGDEAVEGDKAVEEEEENDVESLQLNTFTKGYKETSCDPSYINNFQFKDGLEEINPQGCARILNQLYDILNFVKIKSSGENSDFNFPFVTNKNIVYQEDIFGKTIEEYITIKEEKEKLLKTNTTTIEGIEKKGLLKNRDTRTIKSLTNENQILEKQIHKITEYITEFELKKTAGNIPEFDNTHPNIFIFSSCGEGKGPKSLLQKISEIQQEAIHKMDGVINPNTTLEKTGLYIDTEKLKSKILEKHLYIVEPKRQYKVSEVHKEFDALDEAYEFFEKDLATQEAIESALIQVENSEDVIPSTYIPYEDWKYKYTYLQTGAVELKAKGVGIKKSHKKRPFLRTYNLRPRHTHFTRSKNGSHGGRRRFRKTRRLHK